MLALWKVLLEAQESAYGIPNSIVEQRKREIRREQMGALWSVLAAVQHVTVTAHLRRP